MSNTSQDWPLLRLLVLTCVVSFLLLQVERCSGLEINLRQMLEAWRKRAADSNALDLVAEGQQYEQKKNYTRDLLVGEGADNLEPFTVAEETFPVTIRFSLGPTGESRFEYRGQMISVKHRAYVEHSAIDVFDGSIRKSFIGKSQLEYPGAHFQEGTRAKVALDVRVVPILLLYRAVDNDLAVFQPGKLVVDGAKVSIEERECVLVKHEESMVWVDPGRDFIPTRYQLYSRGELKQSIDIKYRMDDKLGWIPTGWTNARFGGTGQLINSVTVKITEAHLNEQLPADLFDLPPLPDGTWVRNYITDEDYIVQNGGTRRDIMAGEFDGQNYQQLLHSPPPGGKRRWIIIATVTPALILVIVLIVRRYRKRHD